MNYICIQPDDNYHQWQVQNLINNFISKGIEACSIHIVFIYMYEQSSFTEQLFPEVNFYYYKDDRPLMELLYKPSLKPYGMMKFTEENPGMTKVFYHDCDIIFLKRIIKIEGFKGSDVDSYLGIDYLEKTDPSFLSYIKMRYDLKEEDINNLRGNGIGAQYYFESLPESWLWECVYEDTYNLYAMLLMSSSKIQKWCAEMWATWFVLYHQGFQMQKDECLDFAFPTDSTEIALNKNILHNAGIQAEDKKELFFKGDFIEESPYTSKIEKKRYKKDKAAYLYYQSVKDTYLKLFKNK